MSSNDFDNYHPYLSSTVLLFNLYVLGYPSSEPRWTAGPPVKIALYVLPKWRFLCGSCPWWPEFLEQEELLDLPYALLFPKREIFLLLLESHQGKTSLPPLVSYQGETSLRFTVPALGISPRGGWLWTLVRDEPWLFPLLVSYQGGGSLWALIHYEPWFVINPDCSHAWYLTKKGGSLWALICYEPWFVMNPDYSIPWCLTKGGGSLGTLSRPWCLTNEEVH